MSRHLADPVDALERSTTSGRRTRARDEAGLALIATMFVLSLIAVLSVAALNSTLGSLRTAGSDYAESRVFYGAEAGTEVALAQLQVALKDGFLSDDEMSNIQPPNVEGLSFDSFRVERDGQVYTETLTDGPYAGLYALTQDVDINSRAQDVNGAVSGLLVRAKAQAIPIFQFGIYYEGDLEGTNEPPMEFAGRVHANGDIYLSSGNAWYREVITTPNKVFHDRKNHHYIGTGVYINDATGTEVPLDFDSRSLPDPEMFKAESCDKFDCRLQTDAFGVDSLKLPLPSSANPYEVVRAKESDDGESEKNTKFAWNADTYVTVDLTDIRTKADVCAGGGPKKDPDEIVGDLEITSLQKVVPGEEINVKLLGLPNCGGLSGIQVTVRADGATIADFTHNGSCTIQFTVPAGISALEIQVDGVHDGVTMNGTAYWYGLENVNDDTPWPMTTVERTGGKEIPIVSEMCNIFWWEWSAFYDGREQEMKDVLNVDVAQLATWVGTNTNRQAETIYLEVTVPPGFGDLPAGAQDLVLDAELDPAVRVVNAAILPNRLTVASEWPLYTRGNYNRFNKKPAALAGDAITVLSSGWADDENRPPTSVFESCVGQVSVGSPCPDYATWAGNWSMNTAQETTVNSAFLAGHWPTPCDHEESGCFADGSTVSCYDDCYGGGFPNFPRHLEDWLGTVPFHYTGSMISPFTSQKTTGTWNRSYFEPPLRDWSFDTDFRNPELLPPATPTVGFVLRTGLREVF